MTRWLMAARQAGEAGTEPTKPTQPQRPPVLSVKSVLSGGGGPDPDAAPGDRMDADARAYLDCLRHRGPLTYGAAAMALGWGVTRAWQAEAKLRAAGLVSMGPLGHATPKDEIQ